MKCRDSQVPLWSGRLWCRSAAVAGSGELVVWVDVRWDEVKRPEAIPKLQTQAVYT